MLIFFNSSQGYARSVPLDAPSLLAAADRQISAAFEQMLAHATTVPPRLREALAYTLQSGGKRLRPALVMQTFDACGGRGDRQSSAVAAAMAIEMVHTFSLVHDDLPAMDDDHLRRGRPTCHIVYGEALAILAGDALVTLAFETLASHADPAVAPRLIAELCAAAGPAGMIGGQVLDIAGENQRLDLAQLKQIHRLKTGAMLIAACRLGALAADASADQLAGVSTFAANVGLAFQIVDDVLDVTATPEQLGKATNKDARLGKNTYPELLGIEASRAEAQRLLDEALARIAPLGAAADPLRTLARFVVDRLS